MSAMIVSEFTHVFDDVQFALDIRAAREGKGLTQEVVGLVLGYGGGGIIHQLETARYSKSLKLDTFVKLCQLFDLHPFDYFDLQKASTIDLFQKLG